MTAERIPMVFLRGTDKCWALKGVETLEEAFEQAAMELYDACELDPNKTAEEQLEVRWGYLFPKPPAEDPLRSRAAALWIQLPDHHRKRTSIENVMDVLQLQDSINARLEERGNP